MNTEFMKPFLDSVSNVLVTMASMDIKAGGTSIKPDNLPSSDITGLIPMSSSKSNGSLAISFPESVILHIAEKMLGEPFFKIDDEIADLVGELTNMITGGAKSLLESNGYDFEMATPSVIRGKSNSIEHMNGSGNVVVIPFATDVGDFYVEIGFQGQ